MKVFALLVSLFLLWGFRGQAQTGANPFSLEITDWNHASLIYEGRHTYIMTDTSVQVFTTPIFSRQMQLLYAQKISPFTQSIIDLSNLNVEALDTFYFNQCIMPTSGEEYTVTFKNATSNKSIMLHHYYLKQIDSIIVLFNDNLPEAFKIKYLTNTTRQDCALSKK